MAERRMFSKAIILSDDFLDMPTSSRCLYFSLSMLADDDGFINNAKSIMRQVRSSNDDMNILIAKKYLLAFESGIIVVKDWKIHNYIQKDRYKETQYIEEKKQLFLDNERAYTRNVAEAKYTVFGEKIDDVYKLDTQDRLELGKYSVGNSEKERAGACAPTHEIESDIVDENDILKEQLICGAPLFISNNQVNDLLKKLTTDELEHYSRRILGLMAENYTFTTSHYNFILSVWKKERKVKK